MQINKVLKIAALIVAAIIVVFAAIIVQRILFLTKVSKGEKISAYSNPKTAILVVDVQNDTYFMPHYANKDAIIDNINNAIKYADENDFEIIYIKQEYKKNHVDKLLSGGMYQQGSKGSELYSGLYVENENIFSKICSDAFSEKSLNDYLVKNEINNILIIGADASACVFKTATGGVSRGYEVTVLEDCLFARNEKVLNSMLKKYEKEGIKVEALSNL